MKFEIKRSPIYDDENRFFISTVNIKANSVYLHADGIVRKSCVREEDGKYTGWYATIADAKAALTEYNQRNRRIKKNGEMHMKEMRILHELLAEVVRVIDHEDIVDGSSLCDYGALYGLARHAEAVDDYLGCDYYIPD